MVQKNQVHSNIPLGKRLEVQLRLRTNPSHKSHILDSRNLSGK